MLHPTLGGAALLGLISLRKNQAPASTTPKQETPPTAQETVAAEPGSATTPESESQEPKRDAEQRPTGQTANAAPAEGLPTAQAQPNPPESKAPPWTGPLQMPAELQQAGQENLDARTPRPARPGRVLTNKDQAITAVSEELLRLLRLTGPHDPPKV